MFNTNIPQKGKLLISEPFMLDSTFERSVILLCEHNNNGSMGFVLNHQSHLNVENILYQITKTDFPLYIGGPVERSTLFFIHKAYDRLESGIHIVDDIYLGGDFDKLVSLIENNLIDNEEVKFFLGYSGWDPEQLNQEIQGNSWAVQNTFDSSLLFIEDGEDLWKTALIQSGPRYAHVANFPKSPNLN